MSRALWKITAFVSRALNFIAFSCSTGSLSAMTPRLPKPSHWEKPLNASTLLVAAVTRRRPFQFLILGIRPKPSRCASAKTGWDWPGVSACTVVGCNSEVFLSRPSMM